jgi:hypothetical protein
MYAFYNHFSSIWIELFVRGRKSRLLRLSIWAALIWNCLTFCDRVVVSLFYWWMDGLKVGGIKSPHASLMLITQTKNWKIKKKQIDKQIELESTKTRNVHKNARIKESQWICLLPARNAAVQMHTPPHILQCAFLEISELGSYIGDEIPTRLPSHNRCK